MVIIHRKSIENPHEMAQPRIHHPFDHFNDDHFR